MSGTEGGGGNVLPMDNLLQLLILRFPAFKGLILDEIAANPRLRTLCADYGDALAAHTAWERASAPQADACARDYRRLIAELERELLRELLDLDARRENSGGTRRAGRQR